MPTPFDAMAYLQSCHTRQLLDMKARLYRVHGGTVYDDSAYLCVCDDHGPAVTLAQIKAVLSTRPHVPNKQEARAIRQAAARQRG